MTVQQAIDRLQLVKNKNLPLCIWNDGELLFANYIDLGISDRVDINVTDDIEEVKGAEK